MSNVWDRSTFAAALLAGVFFLLAPPDGHAQRERPARPAQMSWQAVAMPAGEPGDPLVVSGVVYAADGTTPQPGVVLYAYQADARGLYTPDGQPGITRLHAWMRTDERGRYELRTIRPASYPGQAITAHIHMVVNPDGREQMTAVEFDDDPLMTAAERRRAGSGRFASLCRAQRDASGAQRCTIDLRVTAP
jgi:protocatechuate 3,4-dioxygenase beta subunit